MSDTNLANPANVRALWQNRAITTPHDMPAGLEVLISEGQYPKFPAIPQHFIKLDAAGFEFIHDPSEGQGPWCWSRNGGEEFTRGFATLAEACKDAYWNHIDMAKKIADLKQFGIEVVGMDEALGVNICYWRHMRGHRVSALFPTEEAAWRDAWRIKENIDAEVAGSGVYRHKVQPTLTPTLPEISVMQKVLELAGYNFRFSAHRGWFCPQLNQLDGLRSLPTRTLSQVVKSAWADCIAKGTSEEDLAAVARGLSMSEEEGQALGNSLQAAGAKMIFQGAAAQLNNDEMCLSVLELEQKYADKDWGHHPIHRRFLWKQCVAADETINGYWEWVYNKIQNEELPDEN